jgi:catechol 2,3-dioxygenase-like lactoylglutathione lyase family enzyme
MDAILCGFHHVKLPVSDIQCSLEWYGRVLSLRVKIEFAEEGILKGVALADPGDTLQIALRHDPERVAGLAGFDPVALCVPATDGLREWQRRLESLGEPHGGIVTGHAGSVLVGLHDPDGIEIRLYQPIGEQP